jgi:Tol biopolymer transport system component
MLAAAYFRRAPTPIRVLKFSIAPPDKTTIEFTSPVLTSLPAISPDGRRLVFAATRDGKNQLWLRDLDSLAARMLEGSDGASNPFWSPDSRFVAFFAGGKLKKLDIGGGPPLTLCDAPLGRGGSWSQSDVIVFAPALASGLSRIPAAGGSPTPLTTVDQQRGEMSSVPRAILHASRRGRAGS